MSSFREKKQSNLSTSQKKYTPSLRASNLIAYHLKANLIKLLCFDAKAQILTAEKKMSSFISQKQKASMTVEAALCLPVFLFLFLSLISFIQIIGFQSRMDAALAETGDGIAARAYHTNYYSPLYVKLWTEGYLGKEVLDTSPVVGKSLGIWYGDSKILEEKGIIDLKAEYFVNAGTFFPGLSKIKMQSVYFGHAFTGFELSEQDTNEEDIVYIAEYGEVYHQNRECTYLTLSVSSILRENLEQYRNGKGSRYKKCDYCKQQNDAEIVYIAKDGDSYHTCADCKGLRRTVYAVRIADVAQKSACSRCTGGE